MKEGTPINPRLSSTV